MVDTVLRDPHGVQVHVLKMDSLEIDSGFDHY